MEKVSIPEGARGPWKIERFTADKIDFHSQMRGRGVPRGETFTRLLRNNFLVMSDTPAEMRDHSEAIYRAKGSCLIAGLGIGMVLKNILLRPGVTDVTVIEISQDLIDLVGPHYTDQRVTMICTDIMKYQPPKGKRYQMAWFDIWDEICTDNLPAMQTLARKYGRRADWYGSWSRYLLERGR